MRRVILFIFILSCCKAGAQNLSDIDAVKALLGTDEVEQFSSNDVEHLQDLLSDPLEINIATQTELVSSGLFSAYQAVSLIEYRKEHGDVLSMSELAAVDGFGKEFTAVIAPFIALVSYRVPGMKIPDKTRYTHDLAVKGGVKFLENEPSSWNGGVKYRIKAGDRVSGAFAVSRSVGDDTYLSGHMAWRFKGTDTKVVAGDFNARFGQGLILWNGMSMSGISCASTVIKRAAGISQSWSFTGSSSFTGLAFSGNYGNFTISAMLSEEGLNESVQASEKLSLLPAVNISWLKGCCQFSLTNYTAFSGVLTPDPRIPDFKTSFDTRCCFRGTDLAAEVAYDWVNASPAALFVTSFPVKENVRLAALMRYYSSSYDSSRSAAVRSSSSCSDECGVSFAADFGFGRYMAVNGAEGFGASRKRYNGTFTLDMSVPARGNPALTEAYVKAVNQWDMMLSQSFQMLMKISARVKSGKEHPLRSELRADVRYLSKHFFSTFRFNVVYNIKPALLSYLEGGFRNDVLAIYARQGIFSVDNWDDRIYAYERDAPGSFNVPAYYGRGLWTALTASWRFSRWGRLYFRTSWVSYPLMEAEKKKPGKAELKLQTVISF